MRREIYTQLAGQINVCWSTADNPLNNISSSALDNTFSSLSSAQPTASSYTFDIAALMLQTQTAGTSAIPSASPSSAISSNPASTAGLSGGAIAGIVVGVVAAFIIAVAVTYFLVRAAHKRGQPGPRRAAELQMAEPEHASEPPENQRYYSPQELPAVRR